MSKLEQLIKDLCPDGVEYTSLGEILINNNASDSVSKNDYKEVGKIPIIDQSQAYIAAYTDNESAIPPAFPCIIFGDHTRVVKYADKKFAQGDSGTKVFIPVSDDINAKYIYYAFCNLNIPSRGYNRHWTIVKDITIPLPSLPVQEEIVRILDNFTELTAELTARKKQYDYYRNSLLSESELCTDGVEYRKIKDCFQRLRGTAITAGKMKEIECEAGEIRVFAGGKTVVNANEKDIPNANIIRVPAVFVQSRGVIDVIYFEKPFTFKNEMWAYTHSEKTTVKYLFYFLKNNIQQFRSSASGMGSLPQISLPVTEDFLIPIPPLKEQERIVAILDKFDTLTTSINEGLPAEIEARKQQYEYYRDNLLNFKKIDIEVLI